MPGTGLYFFNAYSSIFEEKELLHFNIKDSDAIHLKEINDAGNVVSIVGKLQFTSDQQTKTYIRNGKRHSEKMREDSWNSYWL